MKNKNDLHFNNVTSSEEISKRILAASEKIFLNLENSRILFNAQELYGSCTSGSSRKIPLAVQVISVEEITLLFSIGREYEIPVYPISTGKNWGYGTANPVENFCIVIDLSLMNKIISFDEDLGTVKIEPGVTQGQLQHFLDEHGYSFLIPSTGAGPNASLMGNLLERGFGITPYTDHFSALLSLEAVLANGEIYRSVFAELDCPDINDNFKWGLGPYLNGLFAQSNFGIVYQCTISLMKKPDSCEAFVFTLKNQDDLIKATEAMKRLNQRLPGILGGLNIMNASRMLSMNIEYPHEKLNEQHCLSETMIKQLAKENKIEAWTGIGGIYGTQDIVASAKKEIRKQLNPFVKDLKFANQKTLRTLRLFEKIIPKFLGKLKIKTLVQRLEKLLNVVEGRPTEAALPLAYWKIKGKHYREGKFNDLIKDGCGLIWYSPLVVNKPDQVETFVSFVTSVCQQYQLEPLITLTTVSDKCFDSTVPLLFNLNDENERQRARDCYNTLLLDGQKLGFFPYRLGIDQMRLITEYPNSTHWSLVKTIKDAIDPKHILSPGRYCPLIKK